VVVTGLGMLTPLGLGVEANWEALMAGRSGIGPITKFDATEYKSRIAGEVRNFNPEDFLDKKAIKRMDDFIQYAVASARMAMEDSGLKVDEKNANQIGCVIGCGLGGLATLQRSHLMLLDRGPNRVSPFFIPMLIGNMAPGQISIEFGLKGPNLCTATACTAGTHAIGIALDLIRNGVCQGVVCGGVEAVVTELAIAGFSAMKALSTRNDEPERASRPFDNERDGFVVGEGAGILVLEELTAALERGANIHAEVIGIGMSADAYHMTAPPEGGVGAASSMRAALHDAGLSPTEVDYINAHGTSTDLNDLYETQAIKAVFGEHARRLPISSTKSMTGHLLGAAGGIEAIYTVLTLERGMIPPTINYENPDPNCDLDYVPNLARPTQAEVALSNSFGFGGTNATLVLKSYRS
jgi:3-oxoacyl-[acyl-carrier-protein] synthase II